MLCVSLGTARLLTRVDSGRKICEVRKFGAIMSNQCQRIIGIVPEKTEQATQHSSCTIQESEAECSLSIPLPSR